MKCPNAGMLLFMICIAVHSAHSQKASSAKSDLLVATQTASFGPLIPGGAGGPPIIVLPIRLSIPQSTATRRYRISAVSSFSFMPAAPAAGGKTISASDIGIGVTGVTTPTGNPRPSISAGFDYDPSTVGRGKGGSSPYTGAANGRATLADLTQSREILQVDQMPVANVPGGNTDLTVTMKLAVQPQFFTPGAWSGAITLIATAP